MRLPVRIYGDPVLRELRKEVDEFGPDLRQFVADLLETMREERGVGLAAQQVGRTDAVCVVDIGEEDADDESGPGAGAADMPLVLVNPRLSEPSRETDSMEEGCLSFPDLRGQIPRAREIDVSYQDIDGTPHQFRARGFLARVIQHEVDHLDGVLFIDRMSPAKRFAIKSKLRRLKLRAASPE